MSENENVLKRSPDKTITNEQQEKKIKLTETSLVLDKSQEEAIDKLVQNSHLAKEKEEVEKPTNDNNNKTNDENKVSLPPITDALTTTNTNTATTATTTNIANTITTTTTPPPAPPAPPSTTPPSLSSSSSSTVAVKEKQTPTSTDAKNASITSEQLLYALTSSVPVPSDKTKPSTTSKQQQQSPTVTKPSTLESKGSIVQKPSSPSVTLPKLPPSTNHTTKPSTTSATSSASHLSSHLLSKLPTTSKTTLGFNSLPDISAALRRLSTTPADGDMTDSASEILGNALAAVAANNHQRSANIGNLAAFTANISNLLHSSHFEDTQKKLAAAVMRQKKKPSLIVNNSQVWKSIEGLEEKSMGLYVYTPQFILPNLENHINHTVEIRVPARYLSYETTKVEKRALWGTDIYTDDSDVVAMLIHSGKYVPPINEDEELSSNDPFALTIAGKTREALEETRKRALTGKTYLKKRQPPTHDIRVVLRVLPKLQEYASSIRHRLKSRHWGKSHDGVSLFVDKVEKIKKGEARLRGKSTLKSNMFIHEQNRKDALGLKEKKQEASQQIRKGRVKKTDRVMRMFKIRSEMMNKQ